MPKYNFYLSNDREFTDISSNENIILLQIIEILNIVFTTMSAINNFLMYAFETTSSIFKLSLKNAFLWQLMFREYLVLLCVM